MRGIHIQKRLLLALLATIFVVLASANVACVAAQDDSMSGGQSNIYQIQLVNMSYNSTDNTQNWTYSVKCVSGKSVSHIVIEFTPSDGPPITAIQTAGFGSRRSGDSWEIRPYTNPDPYTGKSGIKYEFDHDIDKGETRLVWFTLSGVWTTGTIDVAIKADGFVVEKTVVGPDGVTLPVPEVWGPAAALASALGAFGAYRIVYKRKVSA